MTRELPTATVSEMYTHWFAKTWADLKKRYSDPNECWGRILNRSLNVDQLQEILRHNPPVEQIAHLFCQCTNSYQKNHLLAHCILDARAPELMVELNHPERKAQYASLSGLAKNDPILSWDVWSSHRTLWKRYIQLDPVVFDPARTAAQLKVLKLDGLPALVDVLPKINLSVEQIKEMLPILCADLYVAQDKPFAKQTAAYLKRCIKALVKKLPAKDLRIVLQTPPYQNGAWDSVLEKPVKNTALVPADEKIKEASTPIEPYTVDEAKALRNKRLTRVSVDRILESGLDLEWANKMGLTLLQQVVSEGLISALPLVLSHKPNIHARCAEKQTVCHLAVELKDTRALKMLLECGANPWLHDHLHRNSLEMAIKNLNTKAVEILLNHSNFVPLNTYGVALAFTKTQVFDYAHKVIEIFNMLVKSNVNMNWSNKEYPSFVEALAKRCPYQYAHIIPTLKNAMENLTAYKQAIAIENHIQSPTEIKPRKM